jgi:peroxiredoxin
MSEFYGEPINTTTEAKMLPNVTFKTRVRTNEDTENPFTWKDMTTSDYFAGKKCVLFALPGAFTPTCSASHLPGYEEMYDKFKDLGIDEVYCLSVNDAFVMRKWGLDLGLEEDTTSGSLGFKNVKLIPDGACQFTRGMGMSCTWNSERGFGERSWRYSCYVDNMEIKKMFVEQPFVQNSEADPYEVSDPKTMYEFLKYELTKQPTLVELVYNN